MLPHIGISIFSQALVVKTIHLRDLATLVVSSQNGDAIPVADFERHEQSDSFKGVVSPINVVSHEEVIRFWTGTSDPEELGQIVELAVDIAADGYRGAYRLHIGFFSENFLRLENSK
jgi:hypothetical protein